MRRRPQILATFAVLCCLLLSACKTEYSRIVIWTDCSEFAQYITLFNSTHKSLKAVLVYKDNPALSIPPAKDEPAPDLIVGSWLRSDTTQKSFKPLSYIFDRQLLSSDIFYRELLQSGEVKNTPYLLPVSFNLPAIIFDQANAEFIKASYTISPEEIREEAVLYNQKNKNGTFTKIGFTPLNNPDFLYLVAKLYGADFQEQKNRIIYQQYELDSAVNFIRDWEYTDNSSPQEEMDFAFKYLSMTDYRQVSTGRTLFSCITSDALMTTLKEQPLSIDFRWISNGTTLQIEDDFSMIGIYKNATNQTGATEFITWFFDSKNQEEMLSRKAALNLNTEMFGIAGGFSAVQDVTEHILPVYYTHLLSNIPPAELLRAPQKLPARWNTYRSMVVEEYILQSVTSETHSSMEVLENEWRKKVFD